MSDDTYTTGHMNAALVVGMLVGAFFAAIIGVWIAAMDGPMNPTAKKEAVKAGKAEYYLDAENNRQWRWKP